MKAIATEYRGTQYRSRLEARWAVFFRWMGMKYEYEPFEFSDATVGVCRPDFALDGDGFIVEVKPVFPTRLELLKMRAVAKFARGGTLLLIDWPDFKGYWTLTADDERPVFVAPQYYDQDEHIADWQIVRQVPKEFFPRGYEKAVRCAQAARFDGFDDDRDERHDRYA